VPDTPWDMFIYRFVSWSLVEIFRILLSDDMLTCGIECVIGAATKFNTSVYRSLQMIYRVFCSMVGISMPGE
jgi:hypothetical protein